MSPAKIFIIDDEQTITETLKRFFTLAHGLECHLATSVKDSTTLLESVSKISPDLIILDLLMPGLNGLKICELVKASPHRNTPVIIISADDTEANKVDCLNAGADDYIVKPFSLAELAARVNVQLRRNHKTIRLNIGGTVDIDLEKHLVMVGTKNIVLTPTEFTILTVLAENQGKVLSREQIMEHLSCGGSGERTIDVHIRHLREKLGESGKVIENIRSFGYKAG